MRKCWRAVIFAAAMLITWSTARAQVAQPVLSGPTARAHAGHVVLRAGQLLGSRADSATSVVLSAGRGWLLNSTGTVASFSGATPSVAWGTAGASIARYRSSTYATLAVGDPGAAGTTGKVALYYGGATMNTLPDLVLSGQTAGDLFGASVAAVGDLSGDGYGDFAVGAPGAASGTGKVYIYLGGASPSTTPALVLTGSQAGDFFGSAISATGQLDAGGLPEFVVSAPGAFAGRGAVSVFRGGASLSSTPVATLQGDVAASYGERPRFGTALAGGGDLNRDQHADVVVGAPGRDGEKGRAFAYYGGSSAPTSPGLTIAGSEPFAHLGAGAALDTLQTVVNADLVLGLPGASGGHGTVNIYTGGPSVSALPAVQLAGIGEDDRFGTGVAVRAPTGSNPAGALWIGAELADAPLLNAGVAYLYSATAVTGVENTMVAAEADGEPLSAGSYVSTHPQLVLRLAGSDALNLTVSTVSIDSLTVASAQLSAVPAPKPAKTSQATAASTQGGGLSLTPTLTEGAHVLRAQLVSTSGEQAGSIEIHFNAAARLALLAPRLWPNPSHDLVKLAFTLTRPADYAFTVYDVQGRRVFERAPSHGLAEENQFSWDGRTPSGRLESGVYFYRLSAQYRGESVKSQGRLVILR